MSSKVNKFSATLTRLDDRFIESDLNWHSIEFIVKNHDAIGNFNHGRESNSKPFTTKIKSSHSVKVDHESIVNSLRMKDKENRIKRKKDWVKNFSFLYTCIKTDFLDSSDMADVLIKNKINEDFSCKIQVSIHNFLEGFSSKFNVISKEGACENLKYSLVNLISKYKEIEQALNNDVSVSVDGLSGCLSIDIVGKPIGLNYSVNLNLKFLANGNVSFACHDSDSKDDSYVNGVVTRYDSYMSGHKFKSIVDLVKQGE